MTVHSPNNNTHLREGAPEGVKKHAELSLASRTSSPLGHTAIDGARADPTAPTGTAASVAAAACKCTKSSALGDLRTRIDSSKAWSRAECTLTGTAGCSSV